MSLLQQRTSSRNFKIENDMKIKHHFYFLPLVIAGVAPLSVQAASTGLNLTVNATIQPGTCYFNTSALTFDFGTVYPANIVNADPTLRPASDDKTITSVAKTSGDNSTRHLGCDPSAATMKFNIDAQGHSALGADNKDIITLFTDPGQTGAAAAGFGITVYKVDTADSVESETPIMLGQDTDMGAPGDFMLRARLVPLNGNQGKDITGGYIHAQATLDISYQ
ncbi:hypothetical protein C2125_11045 [Rahnella aquatilis]|nr:hypothetical protein C2125_11045 [Rahnella aquatilis]